VADSKLTVTLPNWEQSATYSLTPNDTPKLTLEVTAPGYDTSKTLGTNVRTVIATAMFTETDDSANTIVVFWLDESVFVGDTVKITAISGWATDTSGGGESAQTFTDVPITNNSTRTYALIKPTMNFITVPREVVTGNFDVEISVTHYFARNGKEIQVCNFTATDSSANTYSVDVTSMSVSSYSADDQHSVVCYKGTIVTSGLVNGLVTVRATGYPIIGNALAVRTSDGTDGFDDFVVYLDKTSSLNRYYAYVDDGNAGGAPAPSTTRADVVGVAAKAYGNCGAAIAALKAATSHGDAGNCFVVCAASTGMAFTEGTGGGTGSTGDVWCTIEPEESATVVFKQPDILPTSTGGKFRFKATSSEDGTGDLSFDQTGFDGAIVWMTNNDDDMIWLDNVDTTGNGSNGSTLMFYQFRKAYKTGGAATNMQFMQRSTGNNQWALIRGGTFSNCIMQGYNVHGVDGQSESRVSMLRNSTDTTPSFKNSLVTCSTFMSMSANIAIDGFAMGTETADGEDLGILNVLLETVGTQPLANIASADAGTLECRNVCLHHVQTAGPTGGGGGRNNMFYDWSATASPYTGPTISELISMIGCAWTDWNFKGRLNTPTVATRTGNDEIAIGGVGFHGNICIYGSVAGADPVFPGVNGEDTVTTVYVSDLTGTTGGGDYHTASTGWDDRVAIGRQVVPFDLEGTAISTSVTSKCGVYQNDS